VVIGIFINGDVHGADPGAFIAMGAQVFVPRETQDTDPVKQGKYSSQRADHPAKGPLGKS
jgi:hypothetical protein